MAAFRLSGRPVRPHTPEVRHSLYVHIVWVTRDRAPLIDATIAEFLWRYMRQVAAQERAQVLAGGLLTTHVHLLVRLHPVTSISKLLQRLKGGSSVLASKEGHAPVDRPLRWAKGYSIHSVSHRALPNVTEYVRRQNERHPQEAIPGWRGGFAA